MKLLNVTIEDHTFHVYDEDTIIFYGTIHKEEDHVIQIYNALDSMIINVQTMKNGFKLFSQQKKEQYECRFIDGKNGHLTLMDHHITLDKHNLQYRFYSGMMNHKDMLIGYEQDIFIFQIDIYKDQCVMFLKDVTYGAIALLYIMFFHASGKQHSPSTLFLNNLPDDMMNLL